MGSLDGKVAIVTGASRGIGRAIVEKLAEDGAKAVVGYTVNDAAANEVVSKIQDRGGEATAIQADLSKVSGVQTLFEGALEHFGRLDVLVNNAGIIFPEQFSEATEENYEKTFAVNARGVFFAMKEAAKHMEDGGRIVNVSSVNTAMSPPTSAAYSGSKAAVEQFAKVAAKELGRRGITVNSVSPGATDTDMFAGAPPERRAMAEQMSPFGRLGRPEDIADVVAFLASEESRWVTGQTIPANGGLA